ncbi:PQQ-dependent sugar dehydrogenase [Roseicella aerolata]|uniref:PQQ-dependent sugar dehydrogenase n=1 Tax=Roseicella aerolata TaxID=2883479 RepID=A0A9X1L9Z4_9PROT|nr:PQQ-dependent sugar dehydrogenase [Roseicella aerolata]MCB4821648.1 PQQ-dependent sugar dehydrogenase [Roseicella aerolata]
MPVSFPALPRALALAGLLAATAPGAVAWAQAAETRSLRTERGELRVETIARGVEHPWGLAFLAGDRFLVTERNAGRLRIGTRGGGLSRPVEGVPEVYRYEGPTDRSQGGLFDVALHPQFEENRLVYLSYSAWTEEGGGTAVARGRLVGEDGDQPRLEEVRRIFMMNNPDGSGLHFGGRMAFDPRDNTLLLSIGDRRNMNRSQRPADHAGSIIRMKDDGSPAEGNPFLGRDGHDPHVFAIGLRNPQGMAFDPETRMLWLNDHGPQAGDEIHRIEAGKNYGWPYLTGGKDYSGAPVGVGTEREGMEQAVHIFGRTVAPSGLAVYRGEMFPEWRGQTLHGGLAARALVRTRLEDGRVVEEEWMLRDLDRRIRDVRVHRDGSVWLLTEHSDGEVLRLTPAGGRR